MDSKYWIWLAETFGPGSLTPHLLLEELKTPKAIAEADAAQLEQTGLVTAEEIRELSISKFSRAEQILARCAETGIDFVCFDDPCYPDCLRQVYAPPLVLYYWGNLPDFTRHATVGVVGTRYPTEGGAVMTAHFSAELAEAGAIVVSGMAIGIDAAAHRACLQAKGITVGVLCCGVNVDYPAATLDIKTDLLAAGGVVCSELPPDTPTSEQTKSYIPLRNRLIAGLSDVVLVGEAPLKSGVVHTVNAALEQGKEVFCLPPRDIYDPHFLGNMQFLEDGATPVYRVKEVLFPYLQTYRETLNEEKIVGRVAMTVKHFMGTALDLVEKPSDQPTDQDKQAFLALSEEGRAIVSALREEELTVDDLSALLSLPAFQLLGELTELELLGWVAPLSGNRYRRSRAVKKVLEEKQLI